MTYRVSRSSLALCGGALWVLSFGMGTATRAQEGPPAKPDAAVTGPAPTATEPAPSGTAPALPAEPSPPAVAPPQPPTLEAQPDQAQLAPQPSAAPEASPSPAAPEAHASPAPAPAVPEPPAAATPPPPPIKLGASYFTRYELRSGDLPVIGNRPLNADTIFYRARLSLSSAPLELGSGLHTMVYFEPQASGAYDVGGDLSDVSLGLHQGFVSLGAPSYVLDVGRFEMAYGEHLVIGNVGWHQTGRAFNGGRIHIAQGPQSAYLDVFATLLDDGKLDGLAQRPGKSYIGSRDQYFVGAYAGLGPALGKLDLDVYLLSKIGFGGPLTTMSTDDMGEMVSTTVRAKAATRMTLGARVKQAVSILDYRLEAGVQFGAIQADAKTPSVLAYQADGEVGIKAGGALRIAAHGFVASGDDPKTSKNEAWDQLYPTAHKFLGLTDVFGGRTNVAGAALHLTLALSESLKAALDGHLFFRPEPGESESYAASEIDFGLAYAVAPGMSLRGLYGAFIPSEKGSFATDEVQHFLEVELAQVIK